jgi:putative aldouronate transport system substrate-binding protein
MRDGLQIAADWYERGIIDRQFVTRNAPGAIEGLLGTGQVGLWFGPWWSPYTHPDLIIHDPDVILTAIPAPRAADGTFRHAMPAPAGDFVAMTANFPYPELVVKILNLQYDMHRGLNEYAFELWRPSLETAVDWTGAFLTQGVNLEFNDAVPVAGLFARYLVETGGWPTGQRDVTDDIIRWAESAASWVNTGVVDGSNWMDYAARVVGSRVVDSPLNSPVFPVFSYSTPSMADLWAHLQTLEEEMYFRIIMGESPITAFDEFVDAWWAQGGQVITDEVRAIVGD